MAQVTLWETMADKASASAELPWIWVIAAAITLVSVVVAGWRFWDGSVSRVVTTAQPPVLCLDRASLVQARLAGATLTNVSLRGADLSGAQLAGADLSGADLHGASLRGAVLRGANLTGACLLGADLTDAVITAAVLTDVRHDPHTFARCATDSPHSSTTIPPDVASHAGQTKRVN